MKTFASAEAPQAIGPYSQAVEAAGLVFVSGQLPADPQTGNLETDVAEATARCLANMAAILTEAGLSLANVAKTTVFLSDMKNFPAMNAEYERIFRSLGPYATFPARSTIEVAALPRGALIEIECIAARS